MMVCELRVGEVKRRVSESGGMVVKYELVDDWRVSSVVREIWIGCVEWRKDVLDRLCFRVENELNESFEHTLWFAYNGCTQVPYPLRHRLLCWVLWFWWKQTTDPTGGK